MKHHEIGPPTYKISLLDKPVQNYKRPGSAPAPPPPPPPSRYSQQRQRNHQEKPPPPKHLTNRDGRQNSPDDDEDDEKYPVNNNNNNNNNRGYSKNQSTPSKTNSFEKGIENKKRPINFSEFKDLEEEDETLPEIFYGRTAAVNPELEIEKTEFDPEDRGKKKEYPESHIEAAIEYPLKYEKIAYPFEPEPAEDEEISSVNLSAQIIMEALHLQNEGKHAEAKSLLLNQSQHSTKSAPEEKETSERRPSQPQHASQLLGGVKQERRSKYIPLQVTRQTSGVGSEDDFVSLSEEDEGFSPKTQLDDATSSSSASVIPAAHVAPTEITNELERRKREFKERRNQKSDRKEEQTPPGVEVSSPATESRATSMTSPATESRVASPSPSLKQQQEEEEEDDDNDDLEQSMVQSLNGDDEAWVLSFPDGALPLQIDKDKAEQALQELRRRRQELNPTKSSRLPALSPSKKRQDEDNEGYTYKEGYVLKMAESPRIRITKHKANRRYFVLSGNVLVHFKTKHSKVPRGMVSLDRCIVHLMKCEGLHFGFCVMIDADRRHYTLFPDSEKEAIEWTVAIENNSQVVSKQKEDEEALAKKLARRKIHSSKSLLLTSERLIGADLCSPDFKDPLPGGDRSDSNMAVSSPKSEDQGDDDGLATEIGGFYDLLQVSATASSEVIRKSYYKLAKVFHPDKSEKVVDAKKFAMINRAFQVVKDPETRARYDLGERVKHALRRGVLVKVHEDNSGESWNAGFYVSPSFTNCYWQEADFGSILKSGYQTFELRFVQEIIAGEDDVNWEWAYQKEQGKRCLTIFGQRLGHDHVRLELDSPESRDEILDGLRVLRCDQSMLFVQKLEAMLKEGKR